MDRNRMFEFLISIDIFENLPGKNYSWLLSTLHVKNYLPNEFIIKEGTMGDKFFIIYNGVARIYSEKKSIHKFYLKDEKFEKYFHMGDYFGEAALITEEKKRQANV